MIIKPKKNYFPFIQLLKKLISKIIFFLGSLTLLLFLLTTIYYLNSGMYHSYKPVALSKKIEDVILDKHLGFSFFKLNDYLKNEIKSLKFIIFGNQLENVVINIDQKNLYNLELQRKNKLKGLTEKVEKFSRATLNYKDDNYNIKLRVKGDRVLHWYDKNQTSYRIDLRGDDRIWGLEEFSVQKPITRNFNSYKG